MNEQNLRKPRSTNEAREWGHKGGIKSGESRRKKKTIAMLLEQVLDKPVTDEFTLNDIKKRNLPVSKHPTYKEYICASIVVRVALKGQISDLEKLMGILGEQPVEEETATLTKAKELLDSVESVIS